MKLYILFIHHFIITYIYSSIYPFINLPARTALWTLHTYSTEICPPTASLLSEMSRNVSIFLIEVRITATAETTSPPNHSTSHGNTPLLECSLMAVLESTLLHLSRFLFFGTYLPSDWSVVARTLHPSQQFLYLILNILQFSQQDREIAQELKYLEFSNIIFLIGLLETQYQGGEYKFSFRNVVW